MHAAAHQPSRWAGTRQDVVGADDASGPCSFCRKPSTEVELLLTGFDAAICAACIDMGAELLRWTREGGEPPPFVGNPKGRPEVFESHQMSIRLGVPAIDLTEFELEPELRDLIPREVAEEHCAVPVKKAKEAVVVAMANPDDSNALATITKIARCRVEVVVTTKSEIMNAIATLYAE